MADHCAPDSGAGSTSLTTGHVALVGSPNVGKTTLFNALTGLRAKTANYPGVTVTRREAEIELAGRSVTLVDLPGTYSLAPISPDEQVVVDALHGLVPGVDAPDALVIVADATTLERSLLLVAEVMQIDRPTCLVLTMVDEVVARGGAIDVERLSLAIGIPVVGVIGHRGTGIDELRELLEAPHEWARPVMAPPESGAARRNGSTRSWPSPSLHRSPRHVPDAWMPCCSTPFGAWSSSPS